jgi:ADP-ribose pyrophosphatase YjhB (NUDIX family)
MSRPRSTEKSFFRFCPICATPLDRAERDGMTRPTCPACGFVQYRNPVVGVAAIIFEREVTQLLGPDAILAATGLPADPAALRVLMVRRAATYKETYCFPCGYVEFDEDAREAIRREAEEETGLSIEPGSVYAVHSNFHDPDMQSVGIWFHARPVGGTLRPGDDADELIFVRPGEPAVPLAFPTDALVLAELARHASS